MELRKNDYFMPLLFNTLKGKKNWFFLSTVIILVTTFLIPFILGADKEFFIFFGIVEVFALVFINCLVDNNFLHNDSKLAYYKSKPVKMKDLISINIITNVIFTGYLLLLIAASIVFQALDNEILEVFKLIIPWLLAGIFLASLSSVLTGNTLVAGAMTIFNFALPAIIYLIIGFMFSILESLVVGFSANILLDYFVDSFYKLDYIYFIVYSDKLGIDLTYILLLGAILGFIAWLTFKNLKRRKNEYTGNSIVFAGYKYFVSVIACLIVPAFFSVINYGQSFTSEVVVSLVMATLTYYIIVAALEKSFRIPKFSWKVFLVSMVVFIAATGTTVGVASHFKNVVPDAEDVKFAYIGSDTWAMREIDRFIEEENIDEEGLLELQRRYNIILFSEKESIENIINIHREILKDQNYDNDGYYIYNIAISYYLNDGSYIMRSYKINNEKDSVDNKVKDELAAKLLSSKEFKERKYYYIYDDEYYTNNKYSVIISLEKDFGDFESINIDPEEVRPYLIKDIEESFIKDIDKSFLALSNYYYDMPYKEYKESGYYLHITVRDKTDTTKDNYQRIDLMDGFENTKEYLKIK